MSTALSRDPNAWMRKPEPVNYAELDPIKGFQYCELCREPFTQKEQDPPGFCCFECYRKAVND